MSGASKVQLGKHWRKFGNFISKMKILINIVILWEKDCQICIITKKKRKERKLLGDRGIFSIPSSPIPFN
jgi:hypothetical protein